MTVICWVMLQESDLWIGRSRSVRTWCGDKYRFWRGCGSPGEKRNGKLEHKNVCHSFDGLVYSQGRVIGPDLATTLRHAHACLGRAWRRVAIYRALVPFFRKRTGRLQGCPCNRTTDEEPFLAHRHSRSQHGR